jgi:hypothetical protein
MIRLCLGARLALHCQAPQMPCLRSEPTMITTIVIPQGFAKSQRGVQYSIGPLRANRACQLETVSPSPTVAADRVWRFGRGRGYFKSCISSRPAQGARMATRVHSKVRATFERGTLRRQHAWPHLQQHARANAHASDAHLVLPVTTYRSHSYGIYATATIDAAMATRADPADSNRQVRAAGEMCCCVIARSCAPACALQRVIGVAIACTRCCVRLCCCKITREGLLRRLGRTALHHRCVRT